MKRCPYCAEEIQDSAKKCKHCGEWLTISEEASNGDYDINKINNGYRPYQLYFYEKDKSGKDKFLKNIIYAKSDTEAENESEVFCSNNYRRKVKLKKIGEVGRLSCPKCGRAYTVCDKKPGCLFWIVGILTFGILIVILWPFLPVDCHCKLCNYDWKA